jgi:hypothetical protein
MARLAEREQAGNAWALKHRKWREGTLDFHNVFRQLPATILSIIRLITSAHALTWCDVGHTSLLQVHRYAGMYSDSFLKTLRVSQARKASDSIMEGNRFHLEHAAVLHSSVFLKVDMGDLDTITAITRHYS